MKTTLAVWFCLASAMAASAQYRTFGSPTGFGNILFPGVGSAPPMRGGQADPTFRASHGTGFYGAPGRGARPAQSFNSGRVNTVVVPYAFPVYVGGGYAGYDESAGAGYQQQQQQPQSPAVIINQTFVPDMVRPMVREYRDLPEPPRSSLRYYEAPPPGYEPEAAVPDQQKTIYLIAFKDHSIYSAIAYWVEGDTLNYVTPGGVHNRASLELIDEGFSKQLNGERNIDFRLKKQ